MPRPDLGPPDVQVGGYIPYIDLPCERYIGESIGWIAFLASSGPTICYYIPWLCCPIPFEFNNTVAVSSDISCEEEGAIYGAVLFWTMQAISIWGLVLSVVNIFRCSAEIGLGIQDAPDLFQPLLNLILPREGQLDIKNSVLRDKFDLILSNSSLSTILTTIEEHIDSAGDFVDTLNLNNSEARSSRVKRQSGFLGIPIPTLLPIYRERDERTDNCERDEILHVDGECHQILSQGPCEDTEYVLMNPETKKGYCAPRLCNPDRVFVFGDQRCHDPFESDICPPGRQLFTSSYGTPVCGCPYGTYEEEDDQDEDVCEPVLGKLESCDPGQVFWFTSFRSEPECLPDPCKGLNARKGLNELAYVPSIFDGKCYQLGQELPQCPDDTFYTLSYSSLKGICASLEDAGYTVLDEDMLESFSSLYGSRLPRDTSSPSPSSFSSFFSSPFSSNKGNDDMPDIGSSVVIPSFDPQSNLIPLKIGKSAKPTKFSFSGKKKISSSFDNDDSDSDSEVQILPTHATAFSPTALSLQSTSPLAKLFKKFSPKRRLFLEDSEEVSKSRGRRSSIQPHASPETVFQSSLAACRAGGESGINFKCNTKYLPNRKPLSRPKRNIPPITPYPSCPKGSFYTITRQCVSNQNKVRSSLLALGLG